MNIMNDLDKVTKEPQDLAVIKYLIFGINQIWYGIEIQFILELIEYPELTKIPNAPLFFSGLLDLRGKILPVLDLDLYLHKNITKIHAKTCILIIQYTFEQKTNTIGILIERILDIIELPVRSIEKTSGILDKIKPDYIQFTSIIDLTTVVLLNLHNLLINFKLDPICKF